MSRQPICYFAKKNDTLVEVTSQRSHNSFNTNVDRFVSKASFFLHSERLQLIEEASASHATRFTEFALETTPSWRHQVGAFLRNAADRSGRTVGDDAGVGVGQVCVDADVSWRVTHGRFEGRVRSWGVETLLKKESILRLRCGIGLLEASKKRGTDNPQPFGCSAVAIDGSQPLSKP